MNNIRRRLLSATKKDIVLYTKRFYPSGTYYWTVPEGCTEVDVFLVGGGGGCTGASHYYKYGAGGGYTKTYKSSTSGWRDGGAISVTPGQSISIRVGKGGSNGSDGGYSQFMSSSYRANGGGGAYLESTDNAPFGYKAGSGGSGGGGFIYGSADVSGGSDGSDGLGQYPGLGQGHTTRDFGEYSGNRNAGGGGDEEAGGGPSDYSEGSGEDRIGGGGGGYGGGAGASDDVSYGTAGGDGTVLIRYYAYE